MAPLFNVINQCYLAFYSKTALIWENVCYWWTPCIGFKFKCP